MGKVYSEITLGTLARLRDANCGEIRVVSKKDRHILVDAYNKDQHGHLDSLMVTGLTPQMYIARDDDGDSLNYGGEMVKVRLVVSANEEEYQDLDSRKDRLANKLVYEEGFIRLGNICNALFTGPISIMEKYVGKKFPQYDRCKVYLSYYLDDVFAGRDVNPEDAFLQVSPADDNEIYSFAISEDDLKDLTQVANNAMDAQIRIAKSVLGISDEEED